MSGTVTTTTKVFPTDTPDVIPASDDRIMFSDTSDGGKPKDVSISGLVDSIDTISTPKTFTTSDQYDTVRIINMGGGVDTNGALYVKVAASSGGRYIIKAENASGIVFSVRDDGLITFNGQNITSAWTSYTPTRHSGITVSGFTVNSASYKQIGKTVFVQTYLAFTATSTLGTFNITLPKTVVGKHFAGVTWMGGGATFNHMGYCDGNDDTFHFETSFYSGTSYGIMFSATYETD